MQVIVLPDADAVGTYAGDLIADRAEAGTLSVLGVATGSSPLPVYEALERRASPAVRGLTAFALDEYVGLPIDHPESYHAVIEREVTVRLGLDPARVHVPDGLADDIEAAAAAYERAIVDAGGVDLQILGIGSTGHIGFNEPTSSFASRTRIKTLTPETRRDNARFFPSLDDVPLHCVTQGLGTIMDARSVLLVAFGAGKADAVAAAVEGPLTSMCPGSILQMHPNATVLVDEAAAAGLTLRDYYDFVFAHRPAWQR
ncbi:MULTISPECIES: glucosamine-6-phosphate deaminase [Microbacterium]|uniref:glucosamine-6-phosphate deaminase n=1 Tax=Microbacterium TaxID=33882 RepID=UPI0027812DD6|nr:MULTISPECIES: glucosamine-6-phosphate deaminase [Microbacterium]MDQ1085010.1 glucosamine-6-phosphate deaminase [Microbacterium sp. SORGH_AS_0344]MDQ1169715.1 glucosamine-6-phosphate deaminase [Microbacterium proteolyticum]